MRHLKTRQQKQALSLTAVGRLNNAGCTVLSSILDHAMPVIYIEQPSAKLRAKAAHITEVQHGVVNKICVAIFGGCIVRWVDDELPMTAQLCHHLNPYSPELINSWPKHF